ncbi:MAG: bifunctional methylenetetrahydrofolate dehydrogenase/methenyltetrahydrofolate cyclohydrolase FolD [Candidatus Lightella neohaematopini]|nr:bifunctional methylenetetrahydrofolate dehydrogenase/methenyltetrahydrofolate cyclohydrolase FolD [Candidatus Lightella neohaematopini]MCV2524840.1 bifunctional methylenetetrahydrofolate dehydrogenase/methenyltetrahydrofolate cyclohydrolase FolD [Candidatus Lightella neohaematopini]
MIAKIFDGHLVAKHIKNKILSIVQKRIKLGKLIPGLATILVGNNPASIIYIKHKREVCQEVGFFSLCYNLPSTISTIELITIIKKLNKNKKIHGILIQLPLPNNIKFSTLQYINHKKDVDGFHPYNIGRLCQNNPTLSPCTPLAVITLLKYYNINVSGLHAVIINSSNIVGKPMFFELLNIGCTVTIINKCTNNLKYYVNHADLLIVAIGKPNFIPGSWIKLGAIIIDIGINKLTNGKLVGDIDYKNSLTRASYITPVPGGIGPITVAILMKNTLQAAISLD